MRNLLLRKIFGKERIEVEQGKDESDEI